MTISRYSFYGFALAVLAPCVFLFTGVVGSPASTDYVKALARVDGVVSNDAQHVDETIETGVLDHFSFIKSGFLALSFGLSSNSFIIKNGTLTRSAVSDKQVENSYLFDGLEVVSSYTPASSDGDEVNSAAVRKVKQLITLKNPKAEDKVVTFRAKSLISADSITWDGKEFELTQDPQTFRAYQKTARVTELAHNKAGVSADSLDGFEELTYSIYAGTRVSFSADSQTAFYDWSDVQAWNHDILAYKDGDDSVLELVLYDLAVPANGELVIDPIYGLDQGHVVDAQFDNGNLASSLSAKGAVAVGDVNGDGIDDLAIGDPSASFGAESSGSVYVIFGKVGGFASSGPLDVRSNFNIRYDSTDSYARLTFGGLFIGDVNGDGKGDLVFGAPWEGSHSKGSAWVVFSTLIDDVGASTGNIQSLGSSSSYNIRYDGSNSDQITSNRSLFIGDVNGDNKDDLILGSYAADWSYCFAGSIWIMFSTLIDDVGSSTGNVKSFDLGTSYNIRYDGDPDSSMPRAFDIGDLNGDGFGDLVVGGSYGENTNSTSGSVWVVFSTMVDDVGSTTGNILPFSTHSNFNIRFDGAENDRLSDNHHLQIDDINEDSRDDLIIGGFRGTYVALSSLIDTVGSTTGNIWDVTDAGSYNIKFDGYSFFRAGDINRDGHSDLVLAGGDSAWVLFSKRFVDIGTSTGNIRFLDTPYSNLRIAGMVREDYSFYNTLMRIGDVDGDGFGDLVLSDPKADNNGTDSGSVWVLFSTSLEDLGSSTGNYYSLASPSSYDLRFDGARAGDQLSKTGIYLSGDVNGDGANDLVMSSDETFGSADDTGAVYVVHVNSFTASVSGTITHDGQPLEGVVLDSPELGRVSTNSSGVYRFEHIDNPTTYTITPSKAGYAFSPTSVTDTVTTSAVHDFSMSTVVSGTITQRGQPVEGALIQLLSGSESFAATSDANGYYLIVGVPLGNVSIVVKKDGLVLFSEEVTVEAGDSAETDLTISEVSLTSPYYTLWNGFLGTVNILELSNPNTHNVMATVSMYSLDGERLSSTPVTIPASQQIDLLVNYLDGYSDTSYGHIVIDSGSDSLDGRLSLYRTGPGGWASDYQFAYSVPFLQSQSEASHGIYNAWHPGISSGTLTPTWLSIANLGSQRALFLVRCRNRQGEQVAVNTISVPAHGRRDVQAGHEFEVVDAIGVVSVEPVAFDTDYIAVVTRYGLDLSSSTPVGQSNYVYAFATPTTLGNSAKVYLPVGSPGSMGVVEVANLASAQNIIELDWYNLEGAIIEEQTLTLDQYAQRHILASSVQSGGQFGSVAIDGTGPLLAGAAAYYYANNNMDVLAADYTQHQEPFGSLLSSSYNVYLGMQNWLRLINASASSEPISLVFGDEGSMTVVLSPNSRSDIEIPLRALQSETVDRYGRFTLQLANPGALVGTVVRVRRNGDGSVDYMNSSLVR